MNKVGTVTVLGAADLSDQSGKLGLPNLPEESWIAIAERTNGRITARLDHSEIEAVRFGAFSYLLELTHAWPGRGEQARDCAVAVAGAFLELNPLPAAESLTKADLEHFALVIQSNTYDWEGFSIAFLDPEAARLDRLRENLRLSPEERFERQRKLISQLIGARRV